jgi:hypothetical protein
LDDRYEVPEVVTFSELDFEPSVLVQCVSIFTCPVRTFADP